MCTEAAFGRGVRNPRLHKLYALIDMGSLPQKHRPMLVSPAAGNVLALLGVFGNIISPSIRVNCGVQRNARKDGIQH